ncbi:MAG: TonB-dependent receptor [Gammaproteobacteria bacterium]|nr:TonB-dependent receptor [Gammaproteobacteria bacterium]
MQHRLTAPQFTVKPLVLALAATGLLASQPLFAQGSEQSDNGDSERELPAIYVIGKEENAALRQPGAVSIVNLEQLELNQPRSTEDILRTVPGVTVKPEEESAIVANIGVRGLSSADYKTLILEDGVPVAPGLFVGNGRYYNPRVQRMEGIEILKGAASLRYGPSTIGGVINYVTRQPADGVQLSLRGGSFNSREATLEAGGSSPSGDAVFGILATRDESDGFMDKGYGMTDIVLKTGLQIGNNQSLSLKYSDYKSDANISYRGVFLNEYYADSRDNPAPDDWLLSGRRSVDLNHEWEISDTARLNTLVYGSETWRDYWRFNTNNAASAAARSWVYTDALNGNNRSFERFGVESRLQVEHSLFGMTSEAELGLRYMTETMDDVTVAATRVTPRTGPLSKDVRDSADSLALYGQNLLQLTENVALTAGLRIEKYEQGRKDRRRTAAQGATAGSSNTEYLPGLGLTWQFTPELQLFASAYKAFSPALNSDALDGLEDQQLDAERSVNMEVGLRGGSGRLSYEMAAFRMDFDNQIIPANSNSQFQRTNGGATLHQGLELGAGFDLGAGFSINGNTTWIPDAEFDGNRYNANGSINTPDGNRITYTPEWTGNLSLDYSVGGLRSSVNLHHTGEQYTDVANTVAIAESLTGFYTGRIKGYTLLDLNMVYEVNSQLSFSGSIRNLADKRYMASLRQGIYVGTERSVDAGFVYRF